MSSEAVTASTPGTSPAPPPTSRTARTTRTTRATSSPSRMARPSRTWRPFNSCSARTALSATMPRSRTSPASLASRTSTTASTSTMPATNRARVTRAARVTRTAKPTILPARPYPDAGATPEFPPATHTRVAEATGAAGAAVTSAAAAADGEIGIATITYSKASGSTFPLGTTTVTVTAIDEGGNLATSMFTILVQDTTPPVIVLSSPPPATTQGTDPRGAIVSFGATATDAATASPLITSTENPGTFFHVGRTWVTATATDAAGNSSSITFAVVVIDTIAPVITSAPDVVAEATAPWGANVVLNATATDAVGPVTLVYSPLSGSRFALGTTAVTVYAVDGAGNRSATRSFTVTVRDTTPPAITSISPSLFAQATSSAGGKVMYAAAKATDAVGPVTIAYSPLASGATFPVGPTIVTVTAVDGAGNAATASFPVTVQDTTVFTSVSGNATVNAPGPTTPVTYALATATGVLGTPLIAYSQNTGSPFVPGITPVTVTATSFTGTVATRTFPVRVLDIPVITSASPNLVAEATSSLGASVSYVAASATSLVAPPTVSYSIASGAVFPLGTTTVTVTATSAFTTDKATKTFTVQVKDTTAPVILTWSPNVTAEATSSAGATVIFPAATVFDAVGAAPSYSKASGTVFPVGTTTVTVRATDAAGNSAPSQSFTVMVRDTTPPAFTFVSPNLVAQAPSSAGAKVTYAAATATDAVGPVTITYSLPSKSTFPVGLTTVTVTATERFGNAATAPFTVKVQDMPVFTSVSGNVTVNATGPTTPVTYGAATATGVLLAPVITYSQNSGTPFGPGITPVTVTATSSTGTVATRTFQVRVLDIPAIGPVSPNLVAEATSALGASVSYVAASATSLVAPPVVSYSIASGAVFPLGTTTVTVTATSAITPDRATKTFTVQVKDTTAPVILTWSSNVTAEATSPAGATVIYPAATVFDAVGAVPSYSKASGAVFPLGTTTVTVSATDAAGNSAPSKSFTVMVRDTIPPAFTFVSPNLTVEATSSAGAKGTYAAATASDAVAPLTITYSQASKTVFPLGATTVTVVAKDGAGNTAAAIFTITVVDLPVFTSLSPTLVRNATTPAGAVVNYAPATAFDPISAVTIIYSIASGSTFAPVTTTVTVTATNAALLQTTKTFTVRVRDIPVITSVSPDQVIEATMPSGAVVTYSAATATAVVGPVSLSYSVASGATFALGTTNVVVTATSLATGDQATRTFNVTVQDTTPPVITFVSPSLVIEATMPSGAVVNYAPATATDAVGPVTITYSQAPGTVFGLGTTTVSATATDGAGNTSTSSFNVLVRDTTPPVITSIGGDLLVNATSAAGAIVTYSQATATDAVSTPTIFYNLASGTVFPIGTTTVVVAAADDAGNYSFKTFTVTVQDVPVITSVSPNVTVSAAGGTGIVVNYVPTTATDVASPVSLMYSQLSGTSFPVGSTTVTVTAFNASLAMATMSFLVVVTP